MGQMKILVVDDEKLLVKGIMMVLTDLKACPHKTVMR